MRLFASLINLGWKSLRAIGVESVLAAFIPALHRNGWARSRREKRCVNLAGEPIPWLTYPTIAFLERRIGSTMEVFEYGCGASTLWWASRVRRIISVEHDPAWAKAISAQAPANASVLHVPLDDEGRYARQVLSYQTKFHVVVIDGRDRVRCVTSAIEALEPTGVIVFDNSDRPQYEEGYRTLAASGFRRLDFVGMLPMVDYVSETAIFYRTGNCLGI